MKQKIENPIHLLLKESIEGMPGFKEHRSYDEEIDYESHVLESVDPTQVFLNAAMLFPKFIEVEGVILLASHYEEKNWADWRKQGTPVQAAGTVNHAHIQDMWATPRRMEDSVDPMKYGELLTRFWQIAVDTQFPNRGVKVVLVDEGEPIIEIFQPGEELPKDIKA